jgi:hypothetical protein
MTTQAFNLSQFANYLNSSGQVSAAGIQSGVTLASGTVSLYYQASAPTGWTQVTSLNDYALRIVSSSGGSTGGTTAFSTVFTNQTVANPTIGATTLTTSQIPSHSHSLTLLGTFGSLGGNAGPYWGYDDNFGGASTATTTNAGSSGSHTHSVSGGGSTIVLNVLYANIILCSKN